MNQPMPNPDAEPSPVPEATLASSGSISLGLGRTQYDSGGETPHLTSPDTPVELGRLGKYRIQKELGRGGMGAVYLAFDDRLQRKVALKVMLPNAAADRSAKERFLREARAAAQISSDHVVNIFEADEIDGTPYIALQFLQGYPLDDYLNRQGNPSIPQIIRIGQETALGLEAAHQLGLVHRDIKPANLWLESPNGRVKILDFGLARQQEDNVHLTRKGMVVGTPAYMSPEQARNLSLDHRSDLFSLGGVLYRLCTGQLPFSGDTTIALLTALAIDEPTPVRQLNPSVPEPLANLIHRLLAKDPTHRPPTAKAVADELNAIFTWSQTQQQVNRLPVVYVPMAIAPQQEANPFEGITEFGGQPSSSVTQVEVEDAPPPAKPFPTMLVASLLFALLVTVGAVLLVTSSVKKTDPDTANNAPSPTKQTEPAKKEDPQKIDQPQKANAGDVFSLKVGNPAVEMRFRWIPPGRFQMGGDKEANEIPVHKVTISKGFWMAETETTQAQWKAVMGTNPSEWKGDSLPVERVMWTQATEFCEKLTKSSGKPIRLPTDAEWEYACRAGRNTDYHNGNGEENMNRAGWYLKNSGARTHPVGQKEANAWGLHDMHGNVWEFCLDDARPFTAADEIDPQGRLVGNHYARRGGSWFDAAQTCRSAARAGVPSDYQDGNIGFRVCFRPEP